VDVTSSVSISGSQSVSYWLSWADESRVKDSAQGRDVCKYAYLAGKITFQQCWAPEVLPVGVGGVPGRGSIGSGGGSGVGCLHRLGRGAPVHLHLQSVGGVLQCHCGKKGIRPCGFGEAQLGSFPLQPLSTDAQETQHSPLLILDLGTRCVDEILHFLYLGAQKSSLGHFGPIQGQVHVGLFLLHPKFLPCHCSRHVEFLQEISCYF